MVRTNSGDTSKLIDPIDFLKVVCALLIVNYHTAVLEIPLVEHLAKFGFLFNTIFVFISGYFLAANFVSRPVDFRVFLRRRVVRVFPTYHVALLVIGILSLLYGFEISLKGLMLALTGFQYFFGDDSFGEHLWFVAVILSCYVLFPLVNVAVRRSPFMVLASLLLILSAMGSFNAHYYGLGLYESISSNRIHRFFYHFLVFVLAVFVGQRWKKSEILLKPRWIILLAAGVPLFLVDQARGGGLLSLLGVWLILPGFSALIFLIHQRITVLSILIKPLVTVTFEIYLVHYVVIAIVADQMKGDLVGYVLVFGATIGLAFLVGWVAPYYVRLVRPSGTSGV